MKLKNLLFASLMMVFTVIFFNCFPTYKASKIDTGNLKAGEYSDIQAKIFLKDNSIILFPDGFTVTSNFIEGEGTITDFISNTNSDKKIKLPVDSIVAITAYEETTTGGRYFASFLYGLTAAPVTFLGVYCIACPKCCFGSCPTVYLYDGYNYNLQAELFSESISRQLENKDTRYFNSEKNK